MFKWLGDNWFKVSILIILLFLFWWFELRPYYTRINCEKYVNDNQEYKVYNEEQMALGNNINKINLAEENKTTFWYNQCLNEHGIVN